MTETPTAPTVDTPDEDQKFNRLLNAFGKAYHDYIRSDSTSLRFAGDAMDAAREAVEDYVGSRLLAARREVEALRAAATDCADDLEAELRNRYHYPDVHPAMQGKYERDMESVLAVRAALAATPEEPTKTPCKRCHGKGSVPVGTMRVACSDCEGSGAAATQETR